MNAQAIGATETTQANIFADIDSARYVQRSLMMLAFLTNVDAGGRQRVTVDSFGPSTVLPTISSVTNIAGYIGVGSRLFVDPSKVAFNGYRRAIYG